MSSHKETLQSFRIFFDAHLAGEDYVAGPDLTVVDIALGSTIYRWLNMEIQRPEMPNLAAWHDRFGAHSAYQDNIMVTFT